MATTMRVVLVSIALGVLALTAEVAGGPETGAVSAPTLPLTLDDYYPPVSQGPTYLIQMHQLAMPFSGIASDALEGDLANAKVNYETFRQAYVKIAGVIPEWTTRFPIEPVDGLGKAIETGASETIMPALGGVGAICHDCHKVFMAPTQHKYHWEDFKRISLSDPVTGADLTFPRLMQLVESDMTGIAVDMGQGQLDNARLHAKGLRAKFSILKQTCTTCHDTERHYYVDSTVFSLLRRIDSELAGATPSPELLQHSLQELGEESCFKCHLVHIPAAYAKP